MFDDTWISLQFEVSHDRKTQTVWWNAKLKVHILLWQAGRKKRRANTRKEKAAPLGKHAFERGAIYVRCLNVLLVNLNIQPSRWKHSQIGNWSLEIETIGYSDSVDGVFNSRMVLVLKTRWEAQTWSREKETSNKAPSLFWNWPTEWVILSMKSRLLYVLNQIPFVQSR